MMTPWGTAHSIERLEDGVIRVTTATHGAIRLTTRTARGARRPFTSTTPATTSAPPSIALIKGTI